ncbi:Com family DNA-binding transcriptional regulator [Flexibacterium corallicola]|uniref:Com family DNA-binding transcriptional regulator n=1 Tax=Flexibacterium corallicola TaxID=3037259 RepID=UPI0038620752
MESTRCGKCNALLFKSEQGAISGKVEIKCRRCGTLNQLRPIEPIHECPEHQA